MPRRDPWLSAVLEGLNLVGQLGLVAFLSFGLPFALGWALDRRLGGGVFVWVGLAVGVVALYWNGARLLRDFLRKTR